MLNPHGIHRLVELRAEDMVRKNKKNLECILPLDRNRAGDLSVNDLFSITAERDSQLHHKGFYVFVDVQTSW